MVDRGKTWHHSPLHAFEPRTTYMVTAGTYGKAHFFKGEEKCRFLHDRLLGLAERYSWNLQAWAVFSNHYHWIGVSPEDARTLKKFVAHLHTETSSFVNKLDGTPGRRVWFEYWDTCLTFENSYFPRLNYVHNNAVKHGIVELASNYPFCSAAWFEDKAEPGFVRKVKTFGCGEVKVKDEF